MYSSIEAMASDKPGDIPLPMNSNNASRPQNYFPVINYFMPPPPYFPRFGYSHSTVPQRFPFQQNIRQGGNFKQTYFNFNDFNLKRNGLIEKFKELVEINSNTQSDFKPVKNDSNKNQEQKVNVSLTVVSNFFSYLLHLQDQFL